MRKVPWRVLFVAALTLAAFIGCSTGSGTGPLTFTVSADMREFVGASEFRGALEAMKGAGAGSFMVSPGDIDPPGPVYDAVRSVLGSSYPWYPVVGNHEAETPEDMAWLRSFNPGGSALPNIVNVGPGGPGPTGSVETCYSFDWGCGHFVVINEYFTGTVDNDPTGAISAALRTWLDADLAASTRPLKLVFGHEPAYPQPDAEPPHRLRHLGDSLDLDPANRDDFWNLLASRGVKAYICGHTHDYSIITVNGVWQIDACHARGSADTGARSTFLRMFVDDTGGLSYETWRLDLESGRYERTDWGAL
jgi:hypothetical protein